MRTTTDRWIGFGLIGLPLYGALTLWSSLTPQPDPNTQYEAWARFVTTDRYVISHLLGSGVGLILAIFGTFALGTFLSQTRAATMGFIAMVISILGSALFLMPLGVSAFAAPGEGQAFLAGIGGLPDLPITLAGQLMGITFLVVIILSLVGNVLMGIAIWRSNVLPKWSGVLWALAPILMYPMGIAYALLINVHSTPPTVPVGAVVILVAGSWMALSAVQKKPPVPLTS